MQQAQTIFNRLSEVEKSNILGATPAGIEWLADVAHRVDMPLLTFDERVAVLNEVRAMCVLEMAVKSANPWFCQT